jgi:hypothetical protein
MVGALAARWLLTAVFAAAGLGSLPARGGLASLRGIARFQPRSLSGLHHVLMAGAMIWMITAMSAAARMASAGPARSAMAAMSHPATPAAAPVVQTCWVTPRRRARL